MYCCFGLRELIGLVLIIVVDFIDWLLLYCLVCLFFCVDSGFEVVP